MFQNRAVSQTYTLSSLETHADLHQSHNQEFQALVSEHKKIEAPEGPRLKKCEIIDRTSSNSAGFVLIVHRIPKYLVHYYVLYIIKYMCFVHVFPAFVHVLFH